MRQLQLIRNALTETLDTLTGKNVHRELALERIDRFAVERRVFGAAIPKNDTRSATSQRAA